MWHAIPATSADDQQPGRKHAEARRRRRPAPGGQDGRTVRADRADQARTRLGEKKLPPSDDAKRSLIDEGHPELSVRRQCELVGLNRSTLYYEPAPETPENLGLMRLIDREYTAHPFFGSRKVTQWLIGQ